MLPPKPLKAMLFDLDGTVADTHWLILKCYDHAMRTSLGVEGKREIWNSRVGAPLDDILLATCDHYGLPRSSNEELEKIKVLYRAHMRENDADLKPFPGIIQTLVGLKERGVRLAIVTTKHELMAKRHIQTVGLTDFFEVVVAGDNVANYKPHPEPFELALSKLGVSPAEAAMVGDSQFDILGARNAGIFSIAALWGTDSRDDLLAAEPDFVAGKPEELLGGEAKKSIS